MRRDAANSKARTRLDEGAVTHITGQVEAFTVRGDTPGAIYLTVACAIDDRLETSCTCPAPGRCWHKDAAVEWMAASAEERWSYYLAAEARNLR